MTSKNLVSGLAALALLALASCSSEPSDWRPDKKVSVDQVPPGARESYDFDIATDAPSQDKGGAIESPVSSQMEVEQTLDPAKGAPKRESGNEAVSANGEEVDRRKTEEAAAKMQGDTPHDLNDKSGVQKEN
jgi:hypothetical protein